jgi:hypothetical protein
VASAGNGTPYHLVVELLKMMTGVRLSHVSAFDSGDYLHPNDAGYKAMGELLLTLEISRF